MHKTILKLLLASAWAMLLSIAGTAFGQGVTTSGITGVVTDKQGNPVGGATVVATHQPSGTTATTTTRSNGHYDLSGLRIGGPYSVTVSGASVQSNTQGSIFVGLDHPETVDFNLAAEVVTLAAVSVSESKDTTFDPDKMGTATTYDTLQIAEIPTVRRDVQDLANQDTRIGLTTNTSTGEFSMSAQGQNSRYNSFLIDGQQSNDPFGLNANGFTSLRSPVPLDALEALTIDFSPYDVTHTGFTGVLINAVTKSGTNEFHGDVYSYFSDTRLRAPNPGQSPTDPNAGAHDPYSQHTYGFTLGGPIIKNKLFFFVAFDDYMKTGLPYSPIVFAPTGSVLASVIATAQGYGIAPGSIGSKVDSDQKTYLAKLDWNINNLHRLSLIYRRTDSSAPVYSNGSSYIELSSNAYQSNRINDNLSALLNSTWTPNISSEIGLSASRYNGTASLYEPLAPEIYVNGVTGTNLTTGAALTNGQIDLGTNHSYQFNALYTDDYNGHLYANYSWLDHTFKVGADFDKTIVLDDFVQYYTGLYGFASPAAFAAGTPNYIRYQQASPGFTIGQANYYYSFINTGLLAQDTWKPSESLTVVGGIRLDEPFFPTKPLYLPSFQTAFGIPNNTVPNDDFSFEPRIGFNYQLPLPAKLSKWKAQVRGGIGLFQGTNPAVWVGDAYGNTGALNSVISGSSNASATNPPLAAPYTPFNPSNGYVQSLAPPGAPTPSINLVSPSFRPPTSWKSNLALDVSLPWYDLKATIEGDFIQVDKGIYWKNINLNPTGVLAPDGRTLYSSTALNTGFSRTGVYELLNTNQGGSQSYTYQIARPLKNHWAFSAGYTHTHATDVQPLTSSVASSNYNYRAVINPNDNVAHNSAYVVPNKYTFSATYEARFFEMKNTATRVTGIFRMQPGTAYSWVFSNDVNNDGTSGNDAFYVPSGPNDPKVTWSTSASDPTGSIQAAAFWSFVNSSDLKKYEGQIAPPFSSFNPWQQTIDMHLEQDIPLTYGNMKFTLFADCLNFANLFNKHWGIVSGMDFGTGPNSGYNRGVASATINASNQYVYTFSANTLTSLQTFTDLSRYQIQLGAKISF